MDYLYVHVIYKYLLSFPSEFLQVNLITSLTYNLRVQVNVQVHF
jgi:hypothetical protein